MTNLNQKLFKLRNEIGVISKSTTNPFYKSQYFDINQLLKELQPLFESHKLLCLQPIKDGNVTTVIKDLDSDESVSSEIPLPQLQDPQKMGSAITYYRRYTLQSLLGLQAEDDDGNKASGKQEKVLPWLNEGSDEWKAMLNVLEKEEGVTIDRIKKKYKLSATTESKVKELITKYAS